jgi:outer membrane protein assembly factor BamA
MRTHIFLLLLLSTPFLQAQSVDSIPQKDFGDLIKSLKRHGRQPKKDTLPPKVHPFELSIAPAVGYSLSSGVAGILATNTAFYLGDRATTNLSEVLANAIYTQYNQTNIPIEATIWTKNNHFNITADWRLMLYPQDTYGLGSKTTDADATNMNFTYIRLYQSILKNLGANWYAGMGYNLDYFMKTTVDELPENRISDAEAYGIRPKSIASGVTLNVLYDSRKNPINPKGGEQYTNVVYRNNQQGLGSDNNWQSLILDMRKYVSLGNPRHLLAFWSYNALTLSGNPPYQLLPSTGWDTYNNTGRGYIQGRFRGTNMLYLESEYRFPLTRNGLCGGVLFANGESFTEPTSHRFEAVSYGYGVGFRLKVNKHSDTNIGIDYGWGANHSRGFFVNLGEVF